ncbi:Acyl dehydratase [Minicystis rosea]|nr:Acyl dehydratase [Minicystis rosea]
MTAMTVPIRHLLSQGPVLRALGGVALSSLPGRRGRAPSPSVPGPWIEAVLPPRSPALVRDYVQHVGGDLTAYAGRLPPHLFPQWAFPLAAKTLAGLPYPMTRVINAGCRIETRAPLPADEPLVVRARLEAIDDDGRRARITQRVVTGTRRVEEALVAEMHAYVPIGKGSGRGERTRKVVPADATAIASLDLDARAGLDFALLTGDFNPIHWVPLWARAAGFRSIILHGFATMARAFEAVVRSRLGGDPTRLSMFEARFVKPLVLPARVSVHASPAGGVWVGGAPGGDAHLEGRFETHDTGLTS